MFSSQKEEQSKRICPFDIHHKIAPNRYLSHLSKCKSPNRSMFTQCKYNSSHYYKKTDIQVHQQKCNSNPLLPTLTSANSIIYDNQIRKQSKKEQKIELSRKITKIIEPSEKQKHLVMTKRNQRASLPEISKISENNSHINNVLLVQEQMKLKIKQQSAQQSLVSYGLSQCSSCQQFIKNRLKLTKKRKFIQKHLKLYSQVKQKEKQMLKKLTEQEQLQMLNFKSNRQ